MRRSEAIEFTEPMSACAPVLKDETAATGWSSRLVDPQRVTVGIEARNHPPFGKRC